MTNRTTCLNCATEFIGTFCPNCAQRANTARLTLRRVFSWEYLSQVFNLDRGIFRTAKDLFIRPGHMINDYLDGKRKRYFNYVGFILIMLAVEAVIQYFTTNSAAMMMYESVAGGVEQNFPEIRKFLKVEDVEKMLASQKFIYIFLIPVLALVNKWIFRRMGYNIMEHIVAVTFLLAMNTIAGFLIGLLGIPNIPFATYSSIYMAYSFLILGLGLRLLWQFSKRANYSRMGRAWRVALSLISVSIVMALSLELIIGTFAGMRMAEQGLLPTFQ